MFWSQVKDIKTVLKEATLFIPVAEPGNFHLIPQDWTLEVEIVVGTFVPLLGFLVRKNRVIYWMAVFAAIVFLHLNSHLFEFACGVFIFTCWDEMIKVWDRMGILLKICAVLISIIFYSCFFHFSSLFYSDRIFIRQDVDRFLVISGCCLLLSIIISSNLLQKILTLSLFVRIGRLCYGIYLTHMLLLICFADYLMETLHHWFKLPEFVYLLIEFGVFIATTLFISFLTFHLVERPFNKMGKKIGRRLEGAINRLGAKISFRNSRSY
jgi:peptidoglycan/LPS O-acetylase OafA/YrhL